MQPYSGYNAAISSRRESDYTETRNEYTPEDDDDVIEEQPTGKGDGKGKGETKGDKGEKKSSINRVNRACNNCRRMKMRCVGAENPPCKRCRNGGLDCVMEKPGRGGEVGEDRIRSLESQVSNIQNTLTDLVSTLRAGMSSNASNGSGQTPGQTQTTPDYGSSVHLTSSHTPHIAQPGQYPIAGTSSATQPGQYPLASSRGFWGSQMVDPSTFAPQSNFDSTPIAGTNFGFPPRQEILLPRGEGSETGSTPSYRNQASPYNVSDPARPSPSHPVSEPTLQERRQPPPLPAHTISWPPPRIDPPGASTTKGRHMSLPPSRVGSPEQDDLLDQEEIINPLGVMSNMAGLVEAAVERAREEQSQSSLAGSVPLKRTTSETANAVESGGDANSRPQKKTRFSPTLPHGPIVVELQNLPPTGVSHRGKSRVKRTHIHAYPDVVAEGFVTEDEGRELMRIFYAGSSNFIPCYDPSVDTWESLRVRSPFSITAICMVGARVRDGGGPISEVQTACRQHAQRIAVGTLFNPVVRIEAVQAMILLSAFSENGWLPGGHAVRMAVDMGINRSFVHLLRSGMGRGKSREELEEERHLVVHSRVWFCLYLVEHQMAYGMGRPAILREDETIHQCRRLLEHPLSNTSDARLVSTVELMALRAPLHIELTASPDLPIAESTLRRLKQANNDFDAWERYWDRVLSDRFGKGRGDFFRESLIIQRQYAELFVNSQLLRGIRESSDVVNMPDEKRHLAIRAMRNAQKCIEICLRGENYRNGLRYAVHYTHVCAAFAASFLIRIARLFPNELNLKKTAKDVEELATVLSDIPAGRYARSLRLILRRARRAKVIPAASVAPSPKKGAVALPGMTPNQSTPAFSPSQLVNPAYYPTPTSGTNAGASASPGSLLLQQAGQIINDSPSSATDMFEFDSLFAQETLEKAGLTLGEGDQLPLFLDGQSLGATSGPMEMTPFMGMEQFFLPAEVDNRLGGPSGSTEQGGIGGIDQNPLGGDVWW